MSILYQIEGSICTLGGSVVAHSSLARILGECATIRSPPALFFFLKRRLARAQQFHTLCQDQSTVAQRAETTMVEFSLRVSSFPDRFPYYAWTAA